MEKYIDWRVSITHLLALAALAFLGWYRLGAVEARVVHNEQAYMRADVHQQMTANLQLQISTLLEELKELRHELKEFKK